MFAYKAFQTIAGIKKPSRGEGLLFLKQRLNAKII